MSDSPTRANAFDHVVVVLFENRSLDNVLGHLYGPEDGKTFEGVIGKDLSNPIPEWAEHGADRKVVPYTVATDMDSPNPDSGEEWYHTNTQLFSVLDDHNRFQMPEGLAEPWNAPPAPPDPAAPAGKMGFTFDRSGYRVPAILVSPMGRVRVRLQRRIPPHLTDRDSAEGMGPRRSAHPTRRLRPHVRPLVHPRDSARSGDMDERRGATRPRLGG